MEFGGKFVYMKKQKRAEEEEMDEEENEEITEEDLSLGLQTCSALSTDDGKVRTDFSVKENCDHSIEYFPAFRYLATMIKDMKFSCMQPTSHFVAGFWYYSHVYGLLPACGFDGKPTLFEFPVHKHCTF